MSTCFCLILRQVKTLEEEVTLVGNNLRSLEVSEGEVSCQYFILEAKLHCKQSLHRKERLNVNLRKYRKYCMFKLGIIILDLLLMLLFILRRLANEK